jgi:hypothetical protein
MRVPLVDLAATGCTVRSTLRSTISVCQLKAPYTWTAGSRIRSTGGAGGEVARFGRRDCRVIWGVCTRVCVCICVCVCGFVGLGGPGRDSVGPVTVRFQFHVGLVAAGGDVS